MARSSAEKAWDAAFRAAARTHGLRWISGRACLLDDLYISMLSVGVSHPPRRVDVLRVGWSVKVKPLAVDPILWAAFLPETEYTERVAVNRRVNGYGVRPVTLRRGEIEVASDAIPDVDEFFDIFSTSCTEFVSTHPALTDFVEVAADELDRRWSGEAVIRLITALMSVGRADEAHALAADAVARREHGGAISTATVMEFLAAYTAGPETYAAFTESLRATHRLNLVGDAKGSGESSTLARDHHDGRFDRCLGELDRSDHWAVVLDALPRDTEPAPENLTYIQAAGSAEAMSIELCVPAALDSEIVSVRSVVGHAMHGTTPEPVRIEFSELSVTVGAHEVFAADEAAVLFDSFYRTGRIPEEYVLRPDAGYTSAGDEVKLDPDVEPWKDFVAPTQ